MIQAYNYPYCEFSFASWNPVQEKAYPYFEQDCNLVCSASVASGKSAIAEAIFGYELFDNEKSKVIYVSPLKAIGVEKFNEWDKHDTFSKYPKVLVSSDNYVSDNEFVSSRMIVSTIESINIQCRKRSNWIKDVKVLVFDEVHLINNESRGAGSESMLMNLSLLNPNCRLICLSGTLSNHKEIALWLKNLNKKPSFFITSSWRPNKLIQKVVNINTVEEQNNFIESKCRDLTSEKVLVFVHSKFIGERICEHLKKKGVTSAFYNASLRQSIREKMLNDFRSIYSGLDVLIATNSLGMGVTL